MVRKLFVGAFVSALLCIATIQVQAAPSPQLLAIEARERAAVNESFPSLGNRFQIMGESTSQYNCIAWSLGITTQWVWPGDTVSEFDRLNARFGYQRLSRLDYGVVGGVEKIVLYGKYKNGQLVMTHQARQLRDGTWTSKLGQMSIIRHQIADAFENDTYGHPVAVYARRTKHQAKSIFGFDQN